MKNSKVILITGASSGIGKACASYLASLGHRVYGTSRRATFPETFNSYPVLIPMDVTDEESVKKAISFVLEKEGKIDVLINNAGFGVAGAVEDTSYEEALSQFETNFFGSHRVIRHVIPYMREKRSGLIINIGSIAGLIGLPFQPFYSASKFALEGLSEALMHEVNPFNIKVVLVEPGDLKTEFTDRRQLVTKSLNSPYSAQMKKTLAVVEKDERSGGSPEAVARIISKIISSPNPRPRYRVGPFYEKLAVFLRRFLPERIFLWAIRKYYRI
jgi:short-subunit dehydrogenase